MEKAKLHACQAFLMDNIKAKDDVMNQARQKQADISVVDGTLGELILDISGSELRLDNVRVRGEQENFEQKNWAATLTFTQAETVLTKPFRLKAGASLHMTD